ncbi:hypothetical protein IFT66_20990 [Rhizobium sp. CFBP 13726]|uniref:hypothetical protein n=1 Tax=Rhizobium sp. CFBP 13726 TaxID=2775296 RepID=UPI0017843E6E|nr:hypothetical protein [Rhizobium sp. CFBP 13726]MBD8653574.1 hypothetical protein [Rhizobium sp. CFBP 13726]
MCNLYNVTTNQQAIRDFFSISRFREGNLPPSINVHPDREGRSSAWTLVASVN